MATPTISSVSPSTLVAGASPVTVTIVGTNFLTDPTVVIGDLEVADIVESSGTHITAQVAALGAHVRGSLDVTVTNTDAGTVTDAAAITVVSPAVSYNGGNYPYAGSGAPYQGNGKVDGSNEVVGVLPVSSAVEGGVTAAPSAAPYVDTVTDNSARNSVGMDVLNPAFAVSTEQVTEGSEDGITVEAVDAQQGADVALTAAQDAALPPTDADNPVVGQDTGDKGFQVGDEHTAQLPSAPTIGAVSSGSAGHATVNWTAPVDADGYALTGYQIVATSSDGGTSPLTYEVAVGTSATVAGLTSSKHYTFTVAAKNIAGTGAASAASASLAVS